MNSTTNIYIVAIICLLSVPVRAQQQTKGRIGEQTGFGAEEAVRRPVELPPDVLRILRSNSDIQRSCLKRVGSADEIPSSWFIGSRVNLNRDNLPDLVVSSAPANPCLGGANIVPFWVFRNTSKGHQLVLDVSTFNLEILKSRSGRYRDIQTEELTAVKILRARYKFNGRRYRVARSWERPIN